MKTIGLIGGMSWESTVEYYKLINEAIKGRLGGLHSAQCLLYSVDFEEIERFQREGNWEQAAEILIQAAQSLEKGGADFIVLCTNTMHKLASSIEKSVNIPLLHIADATAQRIKHMGIQVVGLLGTQYTMEQEFYKERLKAQGIEVMIPNLEDREAVHKVIYGELCLGTIREASRQRYLDIIQTLKDQGAQAVILGCTEIGLLVKPEDTDVILLDTTVIHAEEAVKYALQNELSITREI